MAEFVFGDMICYRGSIPLGHDEPIMYLGPCNHSDPRDGPTRWLAGDIDMLSIPEGRIDCKDPTMWQKCTHLGGREIRVLVDGKELDPADYTYNGTSVAVHKPIWGDVRIEYVDDGSVKWFGRFP